MAYDHSRKAGNLGDVWKHAVLVAVAKHIPVKSTFRYAESHSGGPVHQLQQHGEWQRGIGDILKQVDDEANTYLTLARPYLSDGLYPSGWSFFATTLSPRVESLSIDLCDISVDVSTQYKSLPRGIKPSNARGAFHEVDGYSYLEDVDADLVFVDPPYFPSAEADWMALAATCNNLKQRGIPHLAWYPIYWPTKPNRLVRMTSQCGWEVSWRAFGKGPCQNLKGCGMLVSNDLMPVLQSARAELDEVARLLRSIDGIATRTAASR